MSHNMRFSTTGEASTLPEVCKLAWHTFYSMQKASEDFENLRFEVWTVAISLDSLHSVGTTSLLIDRQPDQARWALTFSKILTSLGSALRPLYNLVRQYLLSSSKERTTVKTWLLHSEVTFEGVTVQDFRRKLSMLVESLNVFLSCLTHAELARAREMSESEEYRVLSEVTRTVLHKWDVDVVQKSDQNTGYVNDRAGYHTSTNDSTARAYQTTGLPVSPIRLQHNHAPHPSQAEGLQNLDNIEQAFRTHTHAMRRIREQLHHQSINSAHPEDQHSPRFLTVNSSRNAQWGGVHPPLTPLTPTLHADMTSSTRTAELHGDYIETSSSGSSDQSHHSRSTQSSDSGSVTLNSQPTREVDIKPRLSPTRPPLSGHYRKRKRHSQFRFKTGLENEHGNSSDGDGSDDAIDDHAPKTVLEQMLSMVLFFDQ